MPNKTIYLITEEGINLSSIVFLIGIIFVISLLVKKKSKINKLIFNFFIGLSFFLLFFMIYFEYNSISLKKEYQENNYLIITGIVNKYKPSPEGCKGFEEFFVKNIYFALSDCLNTGAFNKTGVFSNGMKVKIYYLNTNHTPDRKLILRIDKL